MKGKIRLSAAEEAGRIDRLRMSPPAAARACRSAPVCCLAACGSATGILPLLCQPA